MKTILLFSLSFFLISATVEAQINTKPVKKVAVLSMPGDAGSNGAAVVWHPVLKKYYASFAGNTEYPLAIFDATYKLLSSDDVTTMFDVRGMWYNTVSKKLEANGYDENGWISYKLNAKGIPEDIVQLQEGMVQPTEQSVGVFDAQKKRISFLKDGTIYSYSLNGQIADDYIELKLKVDEPSETEDELEKTTALTDAYSTNTLCYTGIVNAEFAVLNYSSLQIECYNRKGIQTKSLQLPDDAVVYNNFNFAYANGIFWLFDKNERQWIGYK